MRIYNKKIVEWLILVLIIITFVGVIVYTNYMLDKIADSERQKITIWAEAIHQKADWMAYTEDFFSTISEDQANRANLLGQAFKKIVNSNPNEDITLYVDMIASNKTIPCVLMDEQYHITETKNIDSVELKNILSQDNLQQSLEDNGYKKIPINYYRNSYVYLYYKESYIYTQLRTMMDNLTKNFFSEVVENAPSVPVIITDSSKNEIIAYGNIDTGQIHSKVYQKTLIAEMESDNEPIKVSTGTNNYSYVFYKNSGVYTTLRFLPIIEFLLVILFAVIIYMYINRTKASEQNQVWVGMSKETAHQLGTPISSLMAWSELLKNEHIDDSILNEINKDISRLENIAQRFSKIGSDPKLVDENINTVISEFVAYFKNRTSSKVSFIVNMPQQELHANISRHLFEWVLENLCKNAVDAMNGVGNMTIDLFDNKKYIYIEISDTGKGIENKYQKNIFKPGFTTKERGWGLGLTLTQRIVNEYHKGKIELKNSVVGKGSTFKITLRKNN